MKPMKSALMIASLFLNAGKQKEVSGHGPFVQTAIESSLSRRAKNFGSG
jgi:hypothetical protein